MTTVARLHRFPVKSMHGERLDALTFDTRGAVGDRLWAVRYEDGKLGSGKSSRRFRRTDRLMHYTAAYGPTHADGARPTVTTPDDGPLRDDAHLAELIGAPVRLAREEAVGHFDEGPVSLVTTGSLRALGDLLGDGDPAEVRRFRKNIVLDHDEPWTEDGWPGRELALGDEVRLRIATRIPRCVMTTMSQTGLPEDGRMLKTLTEEREMFFGVVADVLAGGTVRVGDAARLV